jgi:hypothetical protein
MNEYDPLGDMIETMRHAANEITGISALLLEFGGYEESEGGDFPKKSTTDSLEGVCTPRYRDLC